MRSSLSTQVDRYWRSVSDKPRFTLSEHDMLLEIVLSTCCTSTYSCPLTTTIPSPGKSPISAPAGESRSGRAARPSGWLAGRRCSGAEGSPQTA